MTFANGISLLLYWDDAKITNIDKTVKSFILPYGKYCSDIGDSYALRTWKELSDQYCTELEDPKTPTLFDIYEATAKFYLENLDKVEDGFFLCGFQVSTCGTWSSFEA
jgi:hypothetical protein